MKSPPAEPPAIPTEHPTEHLVSQSAEPQLKPAPPSPNILTTRPEWTLLVRLPAEHNNLVEFLINKLGQHPGITEVTKEETTGGAHTQTSIRVKGSIPSLYEAQAELDRAGQQYVSWEKYPPPQTDAAVANRWQTTQWETVTTYPPHPGTAEPSSKDRTPDEKGKPTIQQDVTQTAHTQPLMTGFIKAIAAGAKYGFIRMDDGGDIFVMPSSCTGFENKIPPIGTRVTLEIGNDSRSKKEKAIFVQPEIAERCEGWRDRGKYSAASPIGA